MKRASANKSGEYVLLSERERDNFFFKLVILSWVCKRPGLLLNYSVNFPIFCGLALNPPPNNSLFYIIQDPVFLIQSGPFPRLNRQDLMVTIFAPIAHALTTSHRLGKWTREIEKPVFAS